MSEDDAAAPVAALVPLAPAQTERLAGPPIRPGSWWEVRRPALRGVPVGTIMLCTDVEIADGGVHTVHLATPPGLVDEQSLKRSGHKLSTWRILADELIESFTPSTPVEAQRQRDAEIVDLQTKLIGYQAEIAQAQMDMAQLSTMPVQVLGALAAPANSDAEDGGTGAMVVSSTAMTEDKAQALREQVETRMATLKATTELMTARAGQMQAVSQRMAAYYEERSEAAMALTKPLMRGVARLQESLDTSGLYLGTGLVVDSLVEGDPAPPEAKLTFLQRQLYMDEELLIHLETGGADYRDIGSLGEALKRDPALVERIFAGPRSVVLMQYRRNPKVYDMPGAGAPANHVIRAVHAAAMDNIQNMTSFLLIRDGGRIWQVHLPTSLESLPRLFPTPDDLEAPYTERSWFREAPKRIGPDSIEYAKATETYRQLALQYERVLITLWGLHDRLGVFGDFVDPSRYKSFADPGLHQERFQMIWDDQNLLGSNRPPYREWLKERNAMLRSGSRVMMQWRKAMTSKSCPGAVTRVFRSSREYEQLRYLPDEDYSVAIARREGDHIIVDAPVHGTVWKDHEEHERRFNAKLDLTEVKLYDGDDNLSFLVMDDIDPDDIDFYLNNREARKYYIDYAAILIAVRNQVRQDLQAEEKQRTSLLEAVQASHLPVPEKGWPALVRAAIRIWRADNRGQALPSLEDPQWPKAREQILSKVWFEAGHGNDANLVSRIQKDIADQGDMVLRIARDVKNRVVVYAMEYSGRTQDVVDMTGCWPFVRRVLYTVSQAGTPRVERQASILPNPAVIAAETVIYDHAAIEADPPLQGFDTGLKLKAALAQVSALAQKRSLLLTPAPSQDEVLRALDASFAICRERSADKVSRPILIQAVGLALIARDRYEAQERNALNLIAYGEYAWAWAARHGAPKIIHELTKFIKGIYRFPERALEALPAVGTAAFPLAIKIPVLPGSLDEIVVPNNPYLMFKPKSGIVTHQPVSQYLGNGKYNIEKETPFSVVQKFLTKKKGSEILHCWYNADVMAALEALSPPESASAPEKPKFTSPSSS